MAVARKMQLEDWLDDLCVRFIINLPREDLSSVARICFQIEEAQWFYEDFVRPLDPTLPSMQLRSFSMLIFQHCPLLAPFSVGDRNRAFDEFLQYKTRVPVRGAILLNEAMDATVLVRGWKKGSNWSFPRGKINKDEDDLDCAVREVYEETGFDIRAAGLVPRPDNVKYIEVSLREQQVRLYVFRDVPMDTRFEPKTRKEIGKIQWYRLAELPAFRKKVQQQNQNQSHADGTGAAVAANANKFYMVAPFLGPLKKWVVQQKKKDEIRAVTEQPHLHHLHPHGHQYLEEVPTEDETSWPQAQPITDPQPHQTPGINTVEGATIELQRLLKIQPPTQGIQPLQSTLSQNSSSSNKASALLAMLQPPVPQQNAQPHTPRDHTYSEAPQPQSPHGQHHAAHRVAAGSYQQAPHFPLVPNPDPAGGHSWDYQQPYAGGMMPPQQPPQPQPAPDEPVMMTQQGHHRPTLLHPQPKPPQVQTDLLSRGVYRETPPPNQAAAGMHPQAAYNAASSYNPMYSHPQPGSMPAKGPLAPQPAALLDMLKGVTSTASAATAQLQAPPTAPQPTQHSAAASLQNQVASHHAYYSQTTYNSQQGGSVVSPLAMQVQVQAQAAASAKPNPIDKHRSALLGMFKSDGVAPDSSTGLSTSEHLQRQQSRPTVPPTTSSSLETQLLAALTLGSTTQGFGPGQVAASAAPTIPRALQQAGGFTSQDLFAPGIVTARPEQPQQARQILKRPSNDSPASASRASQSSMRPPPVSRSSPYTTAALVPPTGFGKSPTMSDFPTPGFLSRPSHQTTEQKQKLLSLLVGKQQQQQQQQQHQQQHQGSPGIGAVGMTSTGSSQGFDDLLKGKGKEMAAMSDGTPRSRVASLVSGAGDGLPGASGGDPATRRGSQTPISPADRNFLLGYLQQVAKTANTSRQ